MDRIFERALLYDFYGELLTPHQRNVYEGVVFEDLSLGEIAQEQGISRQGVHDLVKRCDRILQDYESKLHLVERFSAARKKIAQIVALTGGAMPEEAAEAAGGSSAEEGLQKADWRARMERIRSLSEELMKEW